MIECADPAVCAAIAERQREIVSAAIPILIGGLTLTQAGRLLWARVAVSRDS